MACVLALDEGTTSTRAAIFSEDGRTVASAAQEFPQLFPAAGRVEHDAVQIWRASREVIGQALGTASLTGADIAAVGITNQRETTVVWDAATGQPVHHAIVWQDTRGGEYVSMLADAADEIAAITGLPVNTYFAGIKLRWLLDNVPRLRQRAEAGEVLFGTIDTWLMWNLTGGTRGGVHLTDVTNASRTLLMDLSTGQWSERMCQLLDIPAACLPEIRPSVGHFGEVAGGQLLAGVPIAGVLGDQQSAAFGQCGFSPGDTKNTYGTGCFLLTNTGEQIRRSANGLVSTAAYQIEGQPLQYALEGSIAVAGALVQWLRDNLGLIRTADEVNDLAAEVEDNGDVFFVPAFSGLYAPHWRPDARGVLIGMTRFTSRGHIARAALEATAFQTAEVLDVMRRDSGYTIERIAADGGMSASDILMQFQADIAGCEVVRPQIIEATAAGAAYAAGLGTGFYPSQEELSSYWQTDASWQPQIAAADRQRLLARWSQAIERSLGWVES
ncbi:glycerol kinase GlpK [Brevibacterium otitidis]|uniref:ATP:glycerol 3-phosphotransferase n=1 Tax=Brevibacterium otitidis TaxID=53364 RepID=A0ABV5X4H7_9MICO|nr:glycerol kinase GlpK [Brevibacterium otitidis]